MATEGRTTIRTAERWQQPTEGQQEVLDMWEIWTRQGELQARATRVIPTPVGMSRYIEELRRAKTRAEFTACEATVTKFATALWIEWETDKGELNRMHALITKRLQELHGISRERPATTTAEKTESPRTPKTPTKKRIRKRANGSMTGLTLEGTISPRTKLTRTKSDDELQMDTDADEAFLIESERRLASRMKTRREQVAGRSFLSPTPDTMTGATPWDSDV